MADVIDLGEFGPGFTENLHPVYARLRALGPVHRVRLPPSPSTSPARPSGRAMR